MLTTINGILSESKRLNFLTGGTHEAALIVDYMLSKPTCTQTIDIEISAVKHLIAAVYRLPDQEVLIEDEQKTLICLANHIGRIQKIRAHRKFNTTINLCLARNISDSRRYITSGSKEACVFALMMLQKPASETIVKIEADALRRLIKVAKSHDDQIVELEYCDDTCANFARRFCEGSFTAEWSACTESNNRCWFYEQEMVAK